MVFLYYPPLEVAALILKIIHGIIPQDNSPQKKFTAIASPQGSPAAVQPSQLVRKTSLPNPKKNFTANSSPQKNSPRKSFTAISSPQENLAAVRPSQRGRGRQLCGSSRKKLSSGSEIKYRLEFNLN